VTMGSALVFFSRVQDMIPLTLRRTQGAILQRRDMILRTKILVLNGPTSPLRLLMLIEGGKLSKMMTMTRIQNLTLNIMGIKNARPSLRYFQSASWK